MNYLATILTSINGSAGISMGHGQTGMASAADVMSNFCRIFDNYWFAVLLAFIVVILFFIFSRNGIARLTKHLKFTALVIWIAGLVLYMYGFNEGGSENNSLVLFLRASLSSMEMFVSHSDLIEVNGSLHHKAAYMVPFAIVHFCAVLVSAVFIIRLLGLRFVSWVKLVSWRIFRPIIKDKPCFVFFGINGNGILLAKSIKRLFKRNCRIIFINMPDGGHKHEDARFTFSHFFHSSGEGAVKYAGDIEIMEALMFNAEKRVSDISANDSGNNDDSTVFDIFNRLGLSIPFIKTLDFLVNKFAARQKVEFFFLSENESDNISSVLALKSLDKNDSPEIIAAADVIAAIYKAFPNVLNPISKFTRPFESVLNSIKLPDLENDDIEEEEDIGDDSDSADCAPAIIRLLLDVYTTDKEYEIDETTILHFFDFVPFPKDEGIEAVFDALNEVILVDQRFECAKGPTAVLYAQLLVEEDEELELEEETLEKMKTILKQLLRGNLQLKAQVASNFKGAKARQFRNLIK